MHPLIEIVCSWDDKTYKYTVVESPKPKGIDNLDQYVFVVRGRVGMYSLGAKAETDNLTDKQSKETTYFVDINSFILRDASREVLHGVPGISIMEEKLSVSIYSSVKV